MKPHFATNLTTRATLHDYHLDGDEVNADSGRTGSGTESWPGSRVPSRQPLRETHSLIARPVQQWMSAPDFGYARDTRNSVPAGRLRRDTIAKLVACDQVW